MLQKILLIVALCIGFAVCVRTVDASGNWSRIRSVRFRLPDYSGQVFVDVNARCGTEMWVDWSDWQRHTFGTFDHPGGLNGTLRIPLPLQPNLSYRVKVICFTSSEGGDEATQEYRVMYGTSGLSVQKLSESK